MSTRSVIAVMHEGTPRGRAVLSDGYPSWMGHALVRLVNRDGLDTVRRVLTQDWFAWSSINPDEPRSSEPDDSPPRSGGTSVQFLRDVHVKGYGTAFHRADYPDEWWMPGQDSEAEWFYLLHDDYLQVYVDHGAELWPVGQPMSWDLPVELLAATLAASESAGEARS